MANYYTQFSEVILNLTKEERAWLKRALVSPYDLEESEHEVWMMEFCGVRDDLHSPFCSGYSFESNEEGDYLWIYSEESGCVDDVLCLVQCFLKKFRPDQSWSMTWASTCSKQRIGEFGGGWAVVTAEHIECQSAWSAVSAYLTAMEGEGR